MPRAMPLAAIVLLLGACGGGDAVGPVTTSTATTPTALTEVVETTSSIGSSTSTTEPLPEPVVVEIRRRTDTRLQVVEPQEADLYLPSSAVNPVPVVVMFHWVGSGRLEMAPLAKRIADRGLIVLNAEWMADIGDPLPGAADAVCAVAYAYRNAPTWGGDRDRIVVVGHSGGGLVGMLAALTPERFSDLCDTASDSKVWAVVGVASAAGTTVEGSSGWRFWHDDPDELAAMDVYGFIGANPDLIVRFIHGTADIDVPIADTRALHEAMVEAGYDSQFFAIQGSGHRLSPDLVSEAIGIIDSITSMGGR